MGAMCACWALWCDWGPLRCRLLLLWDPRQHQVTVPRRPDRCPRLRSAHCPLIGQGRHAFPRWPSPSNSHGLVSAPRTWFSWEGGHLVCMGTAVVTLGGKSEWVDGGAHEIYWPGNPPHACRPVAAPRGPCASPWELGLLRGPAAGPPWGKWAGGLAVLAHPKLGPL